MAELEKSLKEMEERNQKDKEEWTKKHKEELEAVKANVVKVSKLVTNGYTSPEGVPLTLMV